VALTTNVGHLELVLNYIERCWALSMSLKEDVDNPRSKFYASRKLAKAAKWSNHLVTLCNATADERTKVEAESYCGWLTGNIMLDRGDYRGAIQKLTPAMTVYSELGKVGTLKQQELCRDRVSEIEPTIRFCKYNLDQSTDPDLVKKILHETEATHTQDMLKSKLDSVLVESRKKEAQSMREITWRGERIPIRNDKCRLLIISANDITFELHSKEMDENKLQLYDRLSICYSDAIKLVKDDLGQLRATKLTVKKEAELKSLEYLEEYLTFERVHRMYERNLKLAQQLEAKVLEAAEKGKTGGRGPKPDEVVKCYESVIANVLELSHLKDFDEDAKRLLVADHLSYKATRCFFVGLSYFNVEKWREAMALFAHSDVHIRTAQAHHEVVNPAAEIVEKLERLRKKAMAFTVIAHAKGFLALSRLSASQEKKESDARSGGLLLDNLDKYSASFLEGEEGPKLVDFPPTFAAISCKPLLFDLALSSSCSFPDLTEKKKAPRTGFFSRLWG